jgi:hypothetical protein
MMSLLSLKVPALAQLACVSSFNVFYHRLQCQVLICAFFLLAIHIGNNWKQLWSPKRWSWYGSTYFLVFAFPTMSTQVFKIFSCEQIESKFYLRADYSRQCYVPEWSAYAAWAGIGIVMFVFGFPLFVFMKLWSYRRQGSNNIASKNAAKRYQGRERINLEFLRQDYKVVEPSWMHTTQIWEAVEMLRKLALSIVYSFWSTKSTLCIATALLISSSFLVAHSHFYAWKKPTWNRLQTLSLTTLTLMYFAGLLIKTQHAEKHYDHYMLGSFLVALVVLMFLAVLGAVALELHAVVRWAKELKFAEAQVEQDPAFDPSLHDHIIEPTELTLGKVIGEGAEGCVRAARYAGVEVAVKVTRVTPCSQGEANLHELLKEAQIEAQTLQPLRHPVGARLLCRLCLIHNAT